MTGWPTATASSMFSSSALTMLSSLADDDELVLRVLTSRATAALALSMCVEGRPGATAGRAGSGDGDGDGSDPPGGVG